MNFGNRALTLIELLIVVAIIAILAAIAVPNFLEAQTRAKVTRIRSDVRTVCTALESYAVDHNKYPVPRFIAFQQVGGKYSAAQFIPGGLHPATGGGQVGGVTSPVAYLGSSKLKDVFAIGTFDNEHKDISYQNIDYWYNPGVLFAESGNPLNLTALDGLPGIPPGYFKNVCGSYKSASLGPDKTYNGGRHPYDPTNGSISGGDIFRSQTRTEGGGDNRP